MTRASPSNVATLHALPKRARLTVTHPHGALICRRDRKLGLLRISKCASTELMNRLDCRDWVLFSEADVPVVLFLREPVRRFLSSVGETLLRVQHPAIEDAHSRDRVIVSEDVYLALHEVIGRPVPEVLDAMLDLIEEQPFDAHHEPQISFFTAKDGRLRLDGRVYTVETLEEGLEKIAMRYGVPVELPGDRANVGGAKPVTGSTRVRAFARRITRTGLYRPLPHPPLLAGRYAEASRGAIVRHELNAMANQFAGELKAVGLSEAQAARVRKLYHADIALWSRVMDADDRLLSELF